MKKILGMAVVAALAAGASVFAANPFSDVSTSDWAYQAVADLSGQGIVEGYPDGTFKGQSNITRYEMAQIVARLMAKEDQYNAEQRATIDKLAGEYADELDSLGVRVGNLEKKVGNISWSGDSRVHYEGREKNDDGYTARIRLNMKAQVNDKTTVIGRFKSEADLKGDSDAGTQMDRLHVLYQPTDNFALDIGRTDLFLGQTGYLYDSRFDGVRAIFDTGKTNLEIGYGREYKIKGTVLVDVAGDGISKKEVFYAKAGTKLADAVALNAFYEHFAKTNVKNLTNDNINLWGVGAAFNLGKDFILEGDYIRNTAKVGTIDNPTMWVAGLNYGEADKKQAGTFELGIHYTSADKGAYIGATTLDLSTPLDQSWGKNGVKFWTATGVVTLAKGVTLDANYYFNTKDKDGADLDDSYSVNLNFYF